LNSDQTHISIDLQRRIDQLCDQAESDLRNGIALELAPIVNGQWGDALPSLLTELILVDLEVNGQSVDELRTSYEARLPDHVPLVRQVFESLASRANTLVGSTTGEIGPDFDPSLFIGRTIGDYQIQELLSVGGFGIVYRAVDSILQRTVVIKIPKHIRFESTVETDSFLDEARKAANLNHRNIIGVYHVGVDTQLLPLQRWGLPFIVEEFIVEGDLKQLMLKKRLGTNQAVELVRSIVSGVGYAHGSGIVHRDLKPSNILVTSLGEPVIADFGLAITEQSGRSGQIAGTPRYMSPEQLRGECNLLDGRSDLWSIGVMLFEMLTGPLPEASEFDRQPADLDLDAIDDPELRRICSKCLESNISRRYQSAVELERDLELFQLRESEARFQRMAEQVPGMVFHYVLHSDGSDELTYVSGGVRELFDVEPEEAVADMSKIWGQVFPEDYVWMGEKIRESAETLDHFFVEYRVNHPKRGARLYQAKSQPRRLDNGDVVWDGVVLDITDRKESQIDASRSKEVIDRITSKVPGMVFRYVVRTDGSHAVSQIGTQCRELFEVEPEEAMLNADVLFARVHADDIARIEEATAQSFETLQLKKIEFRVDLPRKGVRWLQSISQPSQSDDGTLFSDGVITDITDQKMAQLALEEAQVQIERITGNIPGMIYQYLERPDGTKQVTYVSSQCREIFGLDPEEILTDANRLFDLDHPDDAQLVQQTTRNAIDQLKNYELEYRVILPGRGVRWMQATGRPTKLDSGYVVLDGFMLDITERKSTEFSCK